MNRPAPSPARASSLRADLILGAVVALVLAFYAWTVAPSRSDWGNTDARGALYNLLVDGFSAGQLHLKTEVPAGLAQLADPYDSRANAPFRTQHHLHDASFYEGKLYLYFGPTPALFAFGPWHWLTGGYLFNKKAVFAFAAFGFVCSALLLRACWRRYFSDVPAGVVAAGVVALGLATSVPELLRIPALCEAAIAAAYAFVMLAALATWHALHADTAARRHRWLVVASLSYGFAVGARPSVLFGAVLLLVPIVHGWRARPRGERLRALAAALVPIALIGVALAAYNHARFGDALEFGQRYQLAGDRQDNARHFSLSYLGFNWRLYFLQFVPWKAPFPFVQQIALPPLPAGHAVVESAQGILANTPVTLFAFAALAFAWRERRAAALAPLRAWLGGALALFATSALVLGLFYGTVLRYQVEFHPALTLLACVGILALESRAHARPIAVRLACRGAWVAALAFSGAFVLLTNIKLLAEELNRQGVQLAQAGQRDAAIATFESALRCKRDLVPAHNNLGILRLAAGDHAAAAAHFEAAARVDPQSLDARNGAGRALAALEKIPEAAEHFRAAVQLQPNFGPAHVNLATMLFKLGRPAEAATHYETALRLGYDAPGVRESLELARQAARGAAP